MNPHSMRPCVWQCVVVGNPANTNAAILAKAAPKIPPENISALTRLDHNRAKSMVAIKDSKACRLAAGTCEGFWGRGGGRGGGGASIL